MSATDCHPNRFRPKSSCATNSNDSNVNVRYSGPLSQTINSAPKLLSVENTPPGLETPPSISQTSTPSGKKVSCSGVSTPFSDSLPKVTVSRGMPNFVSPLQPKEPNLRYSLRDGLKYTEDATSQGSQREKSSSDRRSLEVSNIHHEKKSFSSNSVSKVLSRCNIQKHDPTLYKIFLLLLQPKLKTFELIQLLYSPKDTTVGSIIEMIPENATEPSLGNQVYCGLCRPKTREEILDKDLLASECHLGVVSAEITLGEILVPIPDGYSGGDVALLAKQILSNPKIVKLLRRADPLAPKKSRRSSKRHKSSQRSSPRSRSKEHVEVMEKFDEEDEIKQEQERKMREAMEHAAREAAAANAQIPGGGSEVVSRSRQLSITCVEDKSVESSLHESLDDSYSSWSKSFDASFASSVCAGVSKRHMRRHERQVQRSRILKRAAVMAFVIMLALYFLDPRGFKRQDKGSNDLITATPMGMTGVFQCLFLLLTLYKIERFVRSWNLPEVRSSGIQKHRCPFLKAANSAAKKLKSQCAKNLTVKRRVIQGRFDEDEQSLSRKLRNFSLKANTIQHLEDKTGSL